MNRWERWALRVGMLLTGGSGLFYGAVHYFGARRGEFGPEPHPLQGPLQHVHVLLAPLLVFAIGMATRGHASGMLSHRVQLGRRSGLLLLALSAPMVLSGYGIQVAMAASLRTALAWAHGVTSLVFFAAYVLHWLKPRPKTRRPER